MAFRAAGRTDAGLVRKENQDNFLILAPQMVYAIADGMGGHAGGRQASVIAVETLRQELEDDRAVDTAAVENALAYANDRILDEAKAKNWEGMGTTLVLAFYADGEWRVANIGDSRAYVVNRNEIRAVTKDHSLVEEMVARGTITREEARVHPHRNVLTRALGVDADIGPEWSALKADKADYLLLCSDGLYNMVTDESIRAIVLDLEMTLEEKAGRLVEEANRHGGSDNITVVLIAEEDGL